MKIEFENKILVGADSKAWLIDFTKQVDRLERLQGGKKIAPDTDTEETLEEENFDEEPVQANTKKTGTKKQATQKDELDEELNSDDGAELNETTDLEESEGLEESNEVEDFDEERAKAAPKADTKAKAGRPKKLKVADVNQAAINRCRRLMKPPRSLSSKNARTSVEQLLLRHFGTMSVSEIAETDYAKAIKILDTAK